MAKHYEPGDPHAEDAADRTRPPVTHREVTAAETAAERARVPQNDLGTRVGDLDSGERLERPEPSEAPTPKPRRRSAPKKK